jgi:hypothetical protein
MTELLAKKVYFLLLMFFGFATYYFFESILCLFFAPKYLLYFILSLGSWVLLGLFSLISFFVVYPIYRIIYFKLHHQNISCSIKHIPLSFSIISPLFLYSSILILKHLPGKFYMPINNVNM